MSEIYNQLRPVVAAFDTRISEQNERLNDLNSGLNDLNSGFSKLGLSVEDGVLCVEFGEDEELEG